MDATPARPVGADTLRLIAALSNHGSEDKGLQARTDWQPALDELPSFEALLQLYHKRIYNLAYRLLGDRDEAADLTQETFVRAYKAYPAFRGAPKAVYPWLCRIAVNGCKNRFKELGRRGEHEAFSLDEPLAAGDPGPGLEVADTSANPVGVVEQRELEAKIQEAIQALPPDFRMVIVLRDMQGLAYKEIADITGLTMETVKARLFRGRGILRRRLSPYLEG